MPRVAKKKVNGYKMPKPLPLGTLLKDLQKNEWIIGPSIGKGGFGEIYSAKAAGNSSNGNYPFVVKIEPHENGPLFVEMHFYMKAGKKEDIQEFVKEHNLTTFGMPAFIGSGSHELGDEKYRFVVMEKFGANIQQMLNELKQFSVGTTFKLALQMLYVLEYIHSTGYVHADLKGANILMGCTDKSKHQAYLVDFGLATKFSTQNSFKPDPKRAHDGTIEYLSRDAHKGVPTRRGDLEILAYNIIHWLGGVLPWENLIKDPNKVHSSKEEQMKNVGDFLKTALTSVPKQLEHFLNYINELEFNQKPDYKKIRQLFTTAIKESGDKVDGKLDLGKTTTPKKRKVEAVAKKASPKKVKLAEKTGAKPKRKKKTVDKQSEQQDGDLPDLMTPEMKKLLAKKEERENKSKTKKKTVVAKNKDDLQLNKSTDGFNDEMKAIHTKIKEKGVGKRPKRSVTSVDYRE